ncbi:unnamed protein product [Pieris macdunnoughi]|uniref:Ig-like domain-containing protein n=1 Tax=Pieris macdunnoughi TaxID=345717 RepID=A0A821Y200_9NEOP|nr:unnamed protein product [Pieris macdunnoughi]
MFNLVSLLVTAALVSLQCSRQAYALLERPKLIHHNNLESNEIPTPRRRELHKYVKIDQGLPEIITNPELPLVLQCVIWGKPAPVVTWLKNGLAITDFEEDSNEIFSSHPTSVAGLMSKLVVPAPANGDVYTCVGTAGSKQKTNSTTIYTDEDSEELELPTAPLITAYYNSILQVMGSSITLPCRHYSPTKAQVYWLDRDEELIFDNSRMRVLPSGDLHIKDLSFETDMGQYTCTVKNSYGTDTASTFLYVLRG